MPGKDNPYCEVLGIEVPDLDRARKSRDANYYSLLIAVLLEKGEPVTLAEAARRFEEVGVAPAWRALSSLKRCKPARPPIYRDGDLYALDPHDDEAGLWAFRLGLKSPQVAPLRLVRPAGEELPSAEAPLAVAHLEEAWPDAIPSGLSPLRATVCILDAHGRAMLPEEVIAFIGARGGRPHLQADAPRRWNRKSPVRVREDGRWEVDPAAAPEALRSARKAVIDRLEKLRSPERQETGPVVAEAIRKRAERKQEEHARELARLRRAILVPFILGKRVQALTLLDVNRRRLITAFGAEVAAVVARLADYEVVAAIGVRGLLRRLAFAPERRLLAELGPPQKTKRLNRQGRTLKITTALLVRGSCRISRPFGDPDRMRGYFEEGSLGRLRRRLESDAKSLYALYQYGRLHKSLRLQWGFLDERIQAPWSHLDEISLYDLMTKAHALGLPLEVVVGSAPGWAHPWSRGQWAHVVQDESGWTHLLLAGDHTLVPEEEVQAARLPGQAGLPAGGGV